MDDLYRKRLGDSLLDAKTLYAALGGRAAVSFHFFGDGAAWATPEKTDAVWFRRDPARYDYLAAGRLLGLLIRSANGKRPMPKVAVLYLPGLDEATHRDGVARQVGYVREAVNAAIGALLDGPTGKGGGLREMAGGLAPFTFVLTADHGHSDVRAWIDRDEIEAVVDNALSALPEYTGMSRAARAETFFSAPDGGMMYVYLRFPGAPWTARMFDTERGREVVLHVARALRAAPLLQQRLDMVFADVAPDGALSGIPDRDGDAVPASVLIAARRAAHPRNTVRYFGAVEGLSELGATGGDIVITANADDGFAFCRADTGMGCAERAVHGNLFAEDMRVPLVMAGRGVAPGIVSMPCGNWNAARWVAKTVGVSLPGAPPPSPRRIAQAEPIWLSAPKRWAIRAEPYADRVSAVSSDGGPVQIRLVEAPRGMRVDGTTGLLSWLPDRAASRTAEVVLEAEDRAGRSSRLGFVITVFEVDEGMNKTARTAADGT